MVTANELWQNLKNIFTGQLQKIIFRVCNNKWYYTLLVFSTIFVLYNDWSKYEFTVINAYNFIFAIWLGLLLFPLISEMEFLGMKIKKEVDKATEIHHREIENIKQFMLIQNAALSQNNITISYGQLPTKEEMDSYREINASVSLDREKEYKVHEIDISKDVENLFKLRYKVESSLRKKCEKIGYSGNKSIHGMCMFLVRKEYLTKEGMHFIYQLVNIANRAIHGEIVAKEYVEYAEKIFPEVLETIEKIA